MLKEFSNKATSTPKLSVITPVKNEGERIGKALDSILGQTYRDLEHIIVDGGSTDGSLEQIEQYSERAPWEVKILRNVGGGVYAALNAGIHEANGKYIGLLHGSDNFSAPDILEKAIEKLESSFSDLLYGDLHYENSGAKRVRYYSGRRFRPELLRDGFMPPHPTVIATKALYEKVGDYDTSYPVAADFDWLTRAFLLFNASSVYLPSDMVNMSTGGISGKWKSRLWVNNRDKYRSLRCHGQKINFLRLLKRYLYL